MKGQLGPGAIAGEYVIQKRIAVGGCGTVYLAEHVVLRRRAALKVLHELMATSTEMVERFIREARAVNLIRHPNIVDIYEFGELPGGRPYFVMELLEGQSLDDRLKAARRLTLDEALQILLPLGEALTAAHEAGVVHRDLKGSNVMLLKGEEMRVKLLDFGVAKLLRPGLEPSVTSGGRAIGTPGAMAPEQIMGAPVDVRADVYSLACLLYRMLTGRPPFDSDDVLELERFHLEATPARPGRFVPVAPAVEAAIMRALEKEPARRFPSVKAFLEALRVEPRLTVRARSQAAIALYLDARLAGDETDVDDALVDDLTAVVDSAARALLGAGFVLPLRTASALLGVVLLPPDPGGGRAARGRALALLVSLSQALRRRPGAEGRLRLGLFLHTDRAVVRKRGDEVEIVGGPLLRIGAWVPAAGLDGAAATRAVLEGLRPPLEVTVL